MKSLSPIGLTLSGIYVLLSLYLIATQGLFGESFIVIILGMPWSFLLAMMQFGSVSGFFLYILVLAPLVLNAWILYGIGSLFRKK